MLFLPKRSSLSAQVADAIRANIRTGRWRGRLPSEFLLCDTLQVSRTTLRKALAVLGREGLIESSQGRRRRITGRAKRLARVTPNRVVGLLSAVPLMELPPFIVYHMGELRRHLQDAGYELRVHALPLHGLKRPHRVLEDVMHRTHAACWVLQLSSAPIQEWFAERRAPVIVSGTCHLGVHLPSFDVHYRAVCRHAAGTLLGLGHRRIALFTPRTRRAGDLSGERGFQEAIESAVHGETLPRVLHHDGTPSGIRNALESMLKGPHPLTGLVVTNSRHVLTVFSHLLGCGIRLPAEMSLISRDSDPFLGDVVPPIARYEFNHAQYAGRLARMVLQLATTGMLPPVPHLTMPRLARGGTLAPAPSRQATRP